MNFDEVESGDHVGQKMLAEHLAGLGLEFDVIWHTCRDEIVCDTCGPRHKGKLGEAWHEYPPAHDDCRCTTTIVPKGA